MENYESVSHWGMFPTPEITPNLSSQFQEGWAASLNLLQLEVEE